MLKSTMPCTSPWRLLLSSRTPASNVYFPHTLRDRLPRRDKGFLLHALASESSPNTRSHSYLITMRPRNDSCSSSCSTDSLASDTSDDDEDFNARVNPHWQRYRSLVLRRGFRLDTVRDVREYYERYWEGRRVQGLDSGCSCKSFSDDDNALCRDQGLPDSLFRGTRVQDGTKIIIKAVHIRSREFAVIRKLSSLPLRDDPMNHTIPVLDLIPVPEDDIGFIVMEEWSPQLMSTTPCSLRGLLRALRQCIEGLAFMHTHRIAHLDISLRNVVTDYNGRYTYIDFEMSQIFNGAAPSPRHVFSANDCARGGDCGKPAKARTVGSSSSSDPGGAVARCPRVRGCRATEIPPDVERGADACPFKVDVWALGVLILRACKMAGYDVPELVSLAQPMLFDSSDARPTARAVLQAFDHVVSHISESRLQQFSVQMNDP